MGAWIALRPNDMCTFSSTSLSFFLQSNCDCHAALAELNVLRRERDKLALEVIEARAQLASCDTAWSLNIKQTSQLIKKPTNEPTNNSTAQTAKAIDALATTQVVPGKTAKSSRPSRNGPSRSLQDAHSVALHCSKEDVKAVSDAATDVSKANAIVESMAGMNAGCAECLRMCAKYDYRIACLFRCQHQHENKCTNTKIASSIPQSTLQDRRWLVPMVERVDADCAYCILETVESVGGEGFVQETMHITTDYPILPRPCLPELADVLKSKPLAPLLPQECSVSSRVTATVAIDKDGVVHLNVPASASPLDVACILAGRFRRAEGDARLLATTLLVPSGMGPITMLADLIVNPGETVRIEAGPGTRATLMVGERQLQVKCTANRD